MSDEITVGVVYGGRSSGHTIVQAIDSLGHDARALSTHQLAVDLDSTTVSSSPDVDVVVNWRSPDYDGPSFATHELFRMLEHTTPIVNPTAGVVAASSKLSSAVALQRAGIPIPRTCYSPSLATLVEQRETFDEVVQKPLFNGAGSDVTKHAADEPITLLPDKQESILQTPIETPGPHHWDVRAYVVDGEVVAAMKRTAEDDAWVTNISQEGEGEEFELDASETDLAVAAADALELDAAGVDLIQDTDGNWYVLEVNAPAGVKGITAATGVNPAAYIGALAIRRGGGEVSEGSLRALAEQLGYVTESEAWNNRTEQPRPSFRMRLEADGECHLVGETLQPVSVRLDPSLETSLIRASVLDSCDVSVIDTERLEIGGDVQTRPVVTVTLVKDEIAKTVSGMIVEDENPALSDDIVLTP